MQAFQAAEPTPAVAPKLDFVPVITWPQKAGSLSPYAVGAQAVKIKGNTITFSTCAVAYLTTPYFCGGMELWGAQGSDSNTVHTDGEVINLYQHICGIKTNKSAKSRDPLDLFPGLDAFDCGEQSTSEAAYAAVARFLMGNAALSSRNCIAARDRDGGRLEKLVKHMHALESAPLGALKTYSTYDHCVSVARIKGMWPREWHRIPVMNVNSGNHCTLHMLAANGSDAARLRDNRPQADLITRSTAGADPVYAALKTQFAQTLK
jgi:hypothetical protein